MTDRPNILFIQVDQLTAQTLKSYGDGICHAPTLDALAANGVVFETDCAPSRFSMIPIPMRPSFPRKSRPMPITYVQAGIKPPFRVRCILLGQISFMKKRLTADLYG